MTALTHINQYNTNKQNLKKKIGDVDIKYLCRLVTTSAFTTKIKEVDNKIRSLNVLVKKTDYDAEILEIERKYFTTSKCFYHFWL